MSANVLQIAVGGLSKHYQSIPTKGYIEDTWFLARRKKFLRSRPLVRARAMTDVRLLTAMCCYAQCFCPSRCLLSMVL